MPDWTRDTGNEPLWAGREAETHEQSAVGPGPSRWAAEPPIRVCRECAAQAKTDGAFCPYCGAAYGKKKRFTKRVKIATVVAVVMLLAGAATAGVLVKKHHDDQLAAQKRVHAAAAQRRRDAAAQRTADKNAADDAERGIRKDTVSSLEKSVTKDARGDAATGLIDGPVLKTQCEPTGGTQIDDLSADTGEFSCMAVTDISTDGTMHGYRYTANVDFKTDTYTWHFGG
jgi:hypothetical protein